MTTVQDTLTYADGRKINGQVVITWPVFQFDGVAVASGMQTYEIVDGVLDVNLYSNLNAQPLGVYYTVVYELDEGARYEEYWIIPNLPSVNVGQIRVNFPQTPSVMINALQLLSAGATPGQFLGWNGTHWVPMYVTMINVSPNTIGLSLGSAGADLNVAGSPAALGNALTLNVPDAGPAARGVVTTAAQTFAGAKTFQAKATFSGGITVTGTSTIAGYVPTSRKISPGYGLASTPAGTTDLSADRTFLVVDNTSNQRVQVYQNTVLAGTRHALNFIAGPGMLLTIADNPSSDWVDITLESQGGGGGGGGGSLPIGSASGDTMVWDATPAPGFWTVLPKGAAGTVLSATTTGLTWIPGVHQSPWLTAIDAANYQLNNLAGLGVGTAANASFPVYVYAVGGSGGAQYPVMVLTAGVNNFGVVHEETAAAGMAGFLCINDATQNAGFCIGGSAYSVTAWRGNAVILSNNDIVFANGAGNYPERMRLTRAGFLGIGTASPTRPLAVAANGGAPSVTFNGGVPFLRLESEASWSEPMLEFAEMTNPPIACIAAKNTGGGAGDLIFLTRVSTASAAVERMRITSGGNAGLGTSTPGDKLTVISNDNSDSGGCLQLWSNNQTQHADYSFGGITSSYWFRISSGAGNPLSLQPNGGQVVIGLTAAPVGYPVFIHAAANANLAISGPAAYGGSVCISVGNDVWSTNTPLEIRGAPVVVTQGNFQVWQSIWVCSATADTSYGSAAIQVRETNQVAGGQASNPWAPRISFHWAGRVANQIGMDANGTIRTFDNPGSGFANFSCSSLGINTVSPICSFEVYHPGGPFVYSMSLGQGASSGALAAITGNGPWGLYFGLGPNGTSWIQGGRTDSGTAYSMSLQASGGYVAIGTTANNAIDPLTVTGIAYGQIRLAYGSYGCILRNDSSYFYCPLITNAGDPWGAFNGLRPFSVDLGSGNVSMSHHVSIGNGLALTGSQTITNGWLKTDASAYTNQAGDLGVCRIQNTGTGAVYFGSSGTHYIYWDGTNFNITNSVSINGNCNVTGQFLINGQPGIGGIVVSSGSAQVCSGATPARPQLCFQNGSGMALSVLDVPAQNLVMISYGYVSDSRIKQNIVDLAGGLSVIDQLHPKKFEYGGQCGFTSGTRGAAVVAQEFQAVLPDYVSTFPTKLHPEDKESTPLLTYDPAVLTCHLILAVQELSRRLKVLEGSV